MAPKPPKLARNAEKGGDSAAGEPAAQGSAAQQAHYAQERRRQEEREASDRRKAEYATRVQEEEDRRRRAALQRAVEERLQAEEEANKERLEREVRRCRQLAESAALGVRQGLAQWRRAELRRALPRLCPATAARLAAAAPLPFAPVQAGTQVAATAAAAWDAAPEGAFEVLSSLLVPDADRPLLLEALRLSTGWWLQRRHRRAAQHCDALLRGETFNGALRKWPAFAERLEQGLPAPEAGAAEAPGGGFVAVTTEWARQRWSPAADDHWRLRLWLFRVVSEGLQVGAAPKGEDGEVLPWPLALRARCEGPPPCEQPPPVPIDYLKESSDRIDRDVAEAGRLCDAVEGRAGSLRRRLGEPRTGAEEPPEAVEATVHLAQCPRLRTMVCRLLPLTARDVAGLCAAVRPPLTEYVAPLPDPLLDKQLQLLEDGHASVEPPAVAGADSSGPQPEADAAAGSAARAAAALRDDKQGEALSTLLHADCARALGGAARQGGAQEKQKKKAKRSAERLHWAKVSLLCGAVAQRWDPAAMVGGFDTLGGREVRRRVRSCADAAVRRRCYAAAPLSGGSAPVISPRGWKLLSDGDTVYNYAPLSATLCLEEALGRLGEPAAGEEPDGLLLVLEGCPAALRCWEHCSPVLAHEAALLIPPLQRFRVAQRARVARALSDPLVDEGSAPPRTATQLVLRWEASEVGERLARKVAADAGQAEQLVLDGDEQDARERQSWERMTREVMEAASAGPLPFRDVCTGSESWLTAGPPHPGLVHGRAPSPAALAARRGLEEPQHVAVREQLLRSGLAQAASAFGTAHHTTRALAAALADLLLRSARPHEAAPLTHLAAGWAALRGTETVRDAPRSGHGGSAQRRAPADTGCATYSCGGEDPVAVYAVQYDPAGPQLWLLTRRALLWEPVALRNALDPGSGKLVTAEAVMSTVAALCNSCKVPHDIPALGWPSVTGALRRLPEFAAQHTGPRFTLSDPHFLSCSQGESHDLVRQVLARLPALAAQALETESRAAADDRKGAAVVCSRAILTALEYCRAASSASSGGERAAQLLAADATAVCLAACARVHPAVAEDAALGALFAPPPEYVQGGGALGWDHPAYCVRLCQAGVITTGALEKRVAAVAAAGAPVSRRRVGHFLALFRRFAGTAPLLDAEMAAIGVSDSEGPPMIEAGALVRQQPEVPVLRRHTEKLVSVLHEVPHPHRIENIGHAAPAP